MWIFAMSTAILVLVNVAVWRKPRGKAAAPILLIVLGVTFTFTCIAPFVTILQVLGMTIVWLIWLCLSANPKYFLAASIIATIVAYIPWAIRLKDELQRHQYYVNKYPLESFDHRVPLAGLGSADEYRELPIETLQQLEILEMRLSSRAADRDRQQIMYALRNLHDQKLDVFISRAGFGWERMAYNQLEYAESREPIPPKFDIAQPESPFSTLWTHEHNITISERSTSLDFLNFHERSIADFANPKRFGYIHSPRRAAGFQPHRFNELPEMDAYRVRRLELIGILTHDKPVVYMTEYLPSMTEAVKAPTRSLDEFEMIALARLRKGDDIIVAESPDGLRMVGSIRLAKQCVDCHSGQRGELLGAFTYILKPTK